MPNIGLLLLIISFASSVGAIVCLLVARFARGKVALMALEAGRISAFLVSAALALCCAALVGCFLLGDNSLEYVVRYRSDATETFSWLFKVAGLWAGREGSLLFWTFSVSLFGVVVAAKGKQNQTSAVEKGMVDQRAAANDDDLVEDNANPVALDTVAAAIMFMLVATFAGVLIFANGYNPFAALPVNYVNEAGDLAGVATQWGMSALLEHWGMAIHPPLLFIGYAGFTVPFAYALAALFVGDSSNAWIGKSRFAALLAWLFLTAGIFVGAVWAYEVLGWGGYWGWDAVENASLLPWLSGVALLHSFALCRRTGLFGRWTVFLACLSLSFVFFSAFVTRSGVIGSVHAFDGDAVSCTLFLVLAVLPCVLCGVMLVLRRWAFARGERRAAALGRSGGFSDADQSMRLGRGCTIGTPGGLADSSRAAGFFSKIMAYHLNNLIMIGMAVVLAYVTVAPALPAWLPLGGNVFPVGSYNVVAASVGIAYLGLLAICPMLSWEKTSFKQTASRFRVPLMCAMLLFLLLVIYQFTVLVPRYEFAMGVGAISAGSPSSFLPEWLCHSWATVGFFVAALLAFVSLATLVRAWHSRNVAKAGGSIAHLAMAFLLIGLVGSTFYATDQEIVLAYNAEEDACEELISAGEYEFAYIGMRTTIDENRTDLTNMVELEMVGDGCYDEPITPAIQVTAQTQQQYLRAAVVHCPFEDVVIAYKGISSLNSNDDAGYCMSFEIMINPFISLLWIGFGILAVGVLLALCHGVSDAVLLWRGKRKRIAGIAR